MVTARAQRRSSDQHEAATTNAAPQDATLTTPRARRAPDTYKVEAPAPVAVAGSANAPVKRGRGRPRKDAAAAAPVLVKKQRVATSTKAISTDWSSSVYLRVKLTPLFYFTLYKIAAPGDNQVDVSGNNMNAVLLRKILRAVEEQKDALVDQKEALVAQKAATDAQTASIQELIELSKAQGTPRLNM